MIVWPFKPLQNFTESLEWKTDVIKTKNTEQRFALRPVPRAVYSFSHLFSEQEYTAARAIVRANNSFLVPDWLSRFSVDAVYSGSGVLLDYGSNTLPSVGDSILIWESSSKYESVNVEAVDSNNMVTVGTVLEDYQTPFIMPLYLCESRQGLRNQRPAGKYITGAIDFEFSWPTDDANSTYATYRSHDLISDCPVISTQQAQEDISWEYEIIDNQVGSAYFMDDRSAPDALFLMRWHLFTDSTIADLKAFLHSRKGQWKSFWLSSFGRDLSLSSAIGPTDTSCNVFAPSSLTDLGQTTFDIEINYQGVSYYRQVNSYSEGTEVNGLKTLDLNFSTNLGATINTDARISFLRCLRFNADRIELQHTARSGTTVAVQCIEVDP